MTTAKMDRIPLRFRVEDPGRRPQAEPVLVHYQETLEVVRVARFLDEVFRSCFGALMDGRISEDEFLAKIGAIRGATRDLQEKGKALGVVTGFVKVSVP